MEQAVHPVDSLANDAERLRALHALDEVDSKPEAAFDALVNAASEVCKTPISLLSLVDRERQWPKARHGLPDTTETPRSQAFCAHAILGNGALEVPDGLQDPRFADNPLVVGELGIRFYAGFPLVLSDGWRFGTLCVIDTQARSLDAGQRATMAHLAEAASRMLEMRVEQQRKVVVMEALQRSEARLQAFSFHSPPGIFLTDSEGRCTYTNDRWRTFYGLSAQESLGDGWARALTGATRAAVFEAWNAAVRDGVPFDLEFNVKEHLPLLRRLHRKARALLDGEGQLTGYVGMVHDITDRVEAQREQRAQHLLLNAAIEALEEGFVIFDPAGRLMMCNHVYRQLYQLSEAEFPLGSTYESSPVREVRESNGLHALSKPLTRRRLLAAMTHAKSERAEQLPAAAPRASPMRKLLMGLRILLVEDNPDDQFVATALLRAAGADVSLACDGQEAVERLAHAASLPDVVLMDMQMPVMGGLEATRRLRAMPALLSLPIVAVTANASAADRQSCLDAGMNEHVGKPFDLAHLVMVILDLTRHQASLPAPPPEGSALHVALAEAHGVDLAGALKRPGHDEELYLEMLDRLIQDLRKLPDQVLLDVSRASSLQASRLFHKLKGSAGTLGVQELYEASAAAERELATEQSGPAAMVLAERAVAVMLSSLPRLEALQSRWSEGTWVREGREEPLDRLQAANLQGLRALLERSDLGALDVGSHLGLSAREEVRPWASVLDQSILQLNFPAALEALSGLLVDDDINSILALRSALALDHQLIMARSGAEALQLLQGEPPDLILLDVDMPGMDGYEVCLRPKSAPILRDVPVVFITAHRDSAAEVRGLDVGAAASAASPWSLTSCAHACAPR
jgi:PAS domain S-box-containing protein